MRLLGPRLFVGTTEGRKLAKIGIGVGKSSQTCRDGSHEVDGVALVGKAQASRCTRCVAFTFKSLKPEIQYQGVVPSDIIVPAPRSYDRFSHDLRRIMAKVLQTGKESSSLLARYGKRNWP